MTDVETVLRSGLHAQLDDIEPSTLTAQRALRAGRRAHRARSVVVAAAAGAVLLTGGLTAALRAGDDKAAESIAPASQLTTRAVTYVEQFRAGDFATIRTDMTAGTRGVLTESTLRSGWRETVAAYGSPTGIGDPVVESGSVVTVRVPVRFQRGEINFRVTYGGDGRVIGVTLLTAGLRRLPAAPSALETTARQVVDDLAAGRYENGRSHFDANMTQKLPTDALRSAWQQVAIEQHGGLVSVGGLTATEVGGHTVLDVFCTMHRGELKVRVAFDDVGRIAGLFLLEP
jgi:hypothetical protein